MILSHMQIEEIASAVTKDFNEFFFGKDADNERSTAQATPIDQFAKDYLGLSVSFAHIDRLSLTLLCQSLGVSKSAAIIRLRQLGYIEDRPFAEYDDPLEVWL